MTITVFKICASSNISIVQFHGQCRAGPATANEDELGGVADTDALALE